MEGQSTLMQRNRFVEAVESRRLWRESEVVEKKSICQGDGERESKVVDRIRGDGERVGGGGE